MTDLSDLVKIAVTLQPREDGGLRVYSDDVPGFVLSHPNPRDVLADLKPALELMLSDLLKARVSVAELRSVRERIEGTTGSDDSPPTEVVTRVYLGLPAAP